jgi:hypothetical protein
MASLALSDATLDAAKVGILIAFVVCAVVGTSLLFWLLPCQPEEA